MIARGLVVALVGATFAAACSAPVDRAAPAASPPPATPAPEVGGARQRAFDRGIPVRRAVVRLRRHVDVPVVLPHDRLSLRSYRGWVADPKYLGWGTRRGRRSGTLVLRSRREILWISYGFATPDGCGDRSTAVETDVLGKPALLWTSGQRWSTIVWPVRPHGRVGRFGLSGSFDGAAIVRLAESMQAAIGRPPRHDPGC